MSTHSIVPTPEPKKKRKPGGQTVLTFKVMRIVLTCLTDGTTLEYACFKAGISTDAWQRRMSKDERLHGATTRARQRGCKTSIDGVLDRMRDIALDPNAKDRVGAARVFVQSKQGLLTRIEGTLGIGPTLTRADIERILEDPEKTKNLNDRIAEAIANDNGADGSNESGGVGEVRLEPHMDPPATPPQT